MRTPCGAWPFALRRRKAVPHSEGKAAAAAPPSPPPPPPVEGGGDKEVKKALARLPGRPHRVSNLVAALLAAGGPVAPALADKVAATLVADPALLRALVQLIADNTVAGAKAPRERLRLAWAAASFIAAGPPALRRAVSNSTPLLRELAAVFTAPCFDKARAAIAAQVLHAALADAPRAAAAALAEDQLFVTACVRHIEQNPAAEMLPRLVGTRVFAFNDPGAVVPAHKRSLAALAHGRLQEQLADRFAQAARKDAAVCAAVATVMAEVSARAMALPRMFEDPDERRDGYAFSMTHLSIVSAHVYNDAVDELYLACTPAPLVRVIDTAVEMSFDDDVFVPAFELLSKVLRALHQARSSVLPLVRSAARERDTTALEDALLKRMGNLLPLLSNKTAPANRLGRWRLALVDALLALLLAGSTETVQKMLQTHRVLDAFIALMRAFPHSSVLHTRVSDGVAPLLESEEHALLAVQTSGIMQFFNDNLEDNRLVAHHSSTLRALHSLSTSSDALSDADDAEIFRTSFAPVVAQAMEHDKRGLYREHTTQRVKLEDRLDLRDVARVMTPSEDKGKLLYAKSAGNDLSKKQLGLHDLGEFFTGGAHVFEAANSAFGHFKMGGDKPH